MNKEGEQKIDDNPLFNKVEGLASFANLYIDMSIAPAEAASSLPISGIKIDKVRKMILGIDAEAKDGICDLLMNVKLSLIRLTNFMKKNYRNMRMLSMKFYL